MVRIDGVNCGYTVQGNPYKKSSAGKNVGTVAGLATFAALETIPYSAYVKLYKKAGVSQKLLKNFENVAQKSKSPINLMKKFIKGELTQGVPTNTGMKFYDKVMSLLKNNKSARIAYIALGVGLAALVFGGVGRLAGSVVDTCIDKGAKAEADRNAAIDKNA